MEGNLPAGELIYERGGGGASSVDPRRGRGESRTPPPPSEFKSCLQASTQSPQSIDDSHGSSPTTCCHGFSVRQGFRNPALAKKPCPDYAQLYRTLSEFSSPLLPFFAQVQIETSPVESYARFVKRSFSVDSITLSLSPRNLCSQ